MTTSSMAAASHGTFGWLLRDALTIAQRDVRHWTQQPVTIVMNWIFPVLIALMFGGLFGGAIAVPAGSSYYDFLMPGMFTLSMLFGLGTTILAVRTDANRGVIDRFRSMPISSSAVVLGRCLADMLSAIIGLACLVLTALLLGWQWHNGAVSALAAFGLLLLLRFALLWVGIFAGLNSLNGASVLEYLMWPLSFLSNLFVDPSTMLVWLGVVAAWNPLSATADASRHLFGNPTFPATAATWVSQYALFLSLGWSLLLIAIFLPLSAWAFRNLGN
jgi:ABC-2 type transport system permease protein